MPEVGRVCYGVIWLSSKSELEALSGIYMTGIGFRDMLIYKENRVEDAWFFRRHSLGGFLIATIFYYEYFLSKIDLNMGFFVAEYLEIR